MSNHIQDYWNNQAKKYKSTHTASWGDNWAIDLEVNAIKDYLTSDSLIIDVGCANGFATFFQYENVKPKSIIGIDFAESMIREANKVKLNKYKSNPIDFEVGDVRELRFVKDNFDFTYTTRVLINLPTWDEQIKGIEECLRVTKPGGKVILSEGFWEPLCLLNSVRKLTGLNPLVEHDFNRYIKKERLIDYLNTKDLKFSINNFSSIYYLGSRFLRELVTDIDKYEGYSNPINEIFYNIEKDYSGSDFGIQQIFCIEK